METNLTINGRYSISGLLGSGGMADVYLAHDGLLGRHVAVKILKAGYARDEEFRERFRQEARNAARLSHPNIVAVYDRGEAHETPEEDGPRPGVAAPYIVMEHVAGETLAGRLEREGPLPPAEAARIAASVARALSEAHDRGIVHRDIKPHNVFLQGGAARGGSASEAGVKVGDFGIARVLASPAEPHGEEEILDGFAGDATAVMGTVNYVSPEQALGRAVGPASDLYSLGATLYEMLVGRPPFGGTASAVYPTDWRPEDVVARHATETPLPPDGADGTIPREISALTMRLLEKDPASRFGPGTPGTTGAVASELEHLAESLAGRTAPMPAEHVSKGYGDDPSSGEANPTRRLGPVLPAAQGEANGRRGGGGRRRRRRGIVAAGAAALLFLLLAGPLAAALGLYENPLTSPSEGEAGGEEEPVPVALPSPPEAEATMAATETIATAEETTVTEETTTEETTGTAEENEAEEQLEGAVRDYYEAVDNRDFEYTYRNLTSASRALFSSEDEWVKKNRLIAESEGLKLSSMGVELPGEIPSGSGTAAGARARVTVDRTFADGSTISRETVFVREEDGGAWRHELSEEEIAIFEPDTPLNEFAGKEEPPKEEPAKETTTSSEQEEPTTEPSAKTPEPSAKTPESTSSGTSEKAAGASEERAAEAAVRGHYAAIGRRDFRTAYSYFGPSFRLSTDERRWVAEEESYRIRDAKVNSVRVSDVSAGEATAAVDVSFEDRTGSPRFSISWELVKEGGKWKLDEQSSVAR